MSAAGHSFYGGLCAGQLSGASGLPNFEPLTAEIQQWPLNDLPERVASIVEAISPEIEFVDLTHPLREAAGTGSSPIYPTIRIGPPKVNE
jgi:hypothetical protein